MTTKASIKESLRQSENVCNSYLEDLSDADLLARPIPGINHLAWQLGHLIYAENWMIETTCPGSMPALPAGFKEQHSGDTAGSDDAKAFLTKGKYRELVKEQRKASLAALEKLSDDDLNKPAPESMKWAGDTVMSVFIMVGTHWLMHAGQWAVTRRKLGRKPLF
jgi:hypothetical protein